MNDIVVQCPACKATGKVVEVTRAMAEEMLK